jgi:LL-diaminopimelate aminotransferase
VRRYASSPRDAAPEPSGTAPIRVEVTQSLRDVQVYPFSEWNARCKAVGDRGLDVIRLDIGNPDLPPPDAVIEAATSALHSPHDHRYPGYSGIKELRHAIAAYYRRRFGVSLDADAQVSVLLGSKEGIIHLQRALLNPGDVVLVPDPGYTPYVAGARMAGADVVRFPLAADGAFDFEAIPEGAVRRARLIWLNYPNNPTGGVAEREALERAVAFARQHDLLLCHDAAYTDVRFGTYMPMSLLGIPGAADVAVEFNSLSKTYNMPGWRIGYAVGHPHALRLLELVKSNIDSGMFLPLQRAAVAALGTDDAWIARRNGVYEDRLKTLASILSRVGLAPVVPSATHYLWVPVPAAETAESFAIRWLEAAGVAVAPGTFFGPGGEGFLRVSATVPDEQIDQVEERLRRWAVAD